MSTTPLVSFGSEDFLFDPTDDRAGTLYEVTVTSQISGESSKALVIKINNSLYVIYGDTQFGERCVSGYNDVWFSDWKNPRRLARGEKVTITSVGSV